MRRSIKVIARCHECESKEASECILLFITMSSDSIEKATKDYNDYSAKCPIGDKDSRWVFTVEEV